MLICQWCIFTNWIAFGFGKRNNIYNLFSYTRWWLVAKLRHRGVILVHSHAMQNYISKNERDVPKELFLLDNVVLSPHVAALSLDCFINVLCEFVTRSTLVTLLKSTIHILKKEQTGNKKYEKQSFGGL